MHNGMNSNPRGTYHVYFTYAVNALYLDINADRKSCTCKKGKRCNGSALSNSWSILNHLSPYICQRLCVNRTAELYISHILETTEIKG